MSGHDKTVELYADASGHWRWRVRAANGQVVAASAEAFASKQNAARAVPEEFEELKLVVRGEQEK